MADFRNPAGVPVPPSRYSQSVRVERNAEYLFLSGQVGLEADGSIPADFDRQAELTWDYIERLLADHGMTMANLVKVQGFLTSAEHVGGYKKWRDLRMPEPPPASTVVIVSGFVAPGLLIEIDAVAAREP
ncbi:enamine deaminase RidA (YjgF/YER057c/UK114 family) [Mycoplana sp. BE70]|uniref:RidA family protein n=1 Tax=Mycoplana sp. BE70 TaxID=2817775 RepID=UPI00285FDE3B|nr:RidA family protein [Mycoplana sp. BE70]MDR6759086.1 enamine deaminase RidA (YjgF/YER057c/UK114 family) [Mycoplana sp. BE70]